eukprot:g43159.t1
MKQFSPSLVLCAWMPPGNDLSADIRRGGSNKGNVLEYLLLGPPGTNKSGQSWASYGLHPPTVEWLKPYIELMPEGEAKKLRQALELQHQHFHSSAGPGSKRPSYETEGFSKQEVREVSCQLLCRDDQLDSCFHSRAFSFRREKT